jgi:hypothetical protein
MKLKYLFIILAGIVGASSSTLLFAETTNRAAAESAQPLRIVVDPRVELLSIVFRLAGNPEYNTPRVQSYAEDVEKRFGKFRDHPAVKLAQKLYQTRHISYNAPMSLAVQLTDTTNIQLRVTLRPWPGGLDRRWTASDVNHFVKVARQFVKDTSFQDFIAQHHALYQTTAARMQAVIEKDGHIEWFDTFFGKRPNASFAVIIGLLNGTGNYGAQFRAADGREELYCFLRAGGTDSQGLPEFTCNELPLLVHEFSHSYCNPIVERHFAKFQPSADALYKPVSEQMRSLAYGNGQVLLQESLVRACVIRYRRRYEGEEVGRYVIQFEKQQGFLWMQELSDLLGEYEAHREQYPTLEDFSPRLVAFFAEAAKNVSKMQMDGRHLKL